MNPWNVWVGGNLCLKTERCSNELVAKWRSVPSLITVNIALGMALLQERQRQDGCVGPKGSLALLFSFTLFFSLSHSLPLPLSHLEAYPAQKCVWSSCKYKMCLLCGTCLLNKGILFQVKHTNYFPLRQWCLTVGISTKKPTSGWSSFQLSKTWQSLFYSRDSVDNYSGPP